MAVMKTSIYVGHNTAQTQHKNTKFKHRQKSKPCIIHTKCTQTRATSCKSGLQPYCPI